MRPNAAYLKGNPIARIRFWYAVLLLLFCVFLVRLFYLQVIRHDYYQKAALTTQLKQYEIPAQRGVIAAYNNGQVVPLVLNETLYTLYSDPKFVKDPKVAAEAIQRIIGGDAKEYERLMRLDTRYAILAKKLSKDHSKQIEALKLKGVGTRDAQYRTYPQGTLAAQVLGFVNDEGEGKYGIEQALEAELKGKNGQLKAITDAQGVPLATNKDNIVTEPQSGKRIVLTIDMGMQQQLEEILKSGVENAKGKSGSALILDPKTGAIKAMANFPTYNPGEFSKVEDGSVFNNASVSAPLEVGSIMKPLTAAAALDQGVVTTNSSYYDPASYRIDGAIVRNVEEDGGPGTKTVPDILTLSLNTGATWLLMQMGGGELNEKGRTAWHNYMVNHYQFGKPTGIEQGFEDIGVIPSPTEGYGLNLRYANTAFGQGMTATPLQMASALASIVNGGVYYKPHLVERMIDGAGNETLKQPEIVNQNVVSPETSATMRQLLEGTLTKNRNVYGVSPNRPDYAVGGKTGTAQIAKPEGGYYDDRFIGTYLGFVGGDDAQYVITVRVDEPHIPGYAGAKAAAPIFIRLSDMLIDNFGVTPKS